MKVTRIKTSSAPFQRLLKSKCGLNGFTRKNLAIFDYPLSFLMKSIFIILLFAICIASCKNASFLNRRYTAGSYRDKLVSINQTKKLKLAKAECKIATKKSHRQEKNSNIEQENGSESVSARFNYIKDSLFYQAKTIRSSSDLSAIGKRINAIEAHFLVPSNNGLTTNNSSQKILLKKSSPIFAAIVDAKIHIARVLTLIAIVVGLLALFSGEIIYIIAAFPFIIVLCLLSITLAAKCFGQGFFSNFNAVFVILTNIFIIALSIFIFTLLFL